MSDSFGPKARDNNNRSFSGPSWAVGPSTGEVSAPTAEQLKVLLESMESSPGDFPRLVKSVKDATMENGVTDDRSTAAVSRRRRRSTSTDRSSDHKQSKKLVTDVEPESPTQQHSVDGETSADTDTEDGNDGFSAVQRRKGQRHRTTGQHTENKTTSNRTQLTVYVKGQSVNMEKEAMRKPQQFKKSSLTSVVRSTSWRHVTAAFASYAEQQNKETVCFI